MKIYEIFAGVEVSSLEMNWHFKYWKLVIKLSMIKMLNAIPQDIGE